MLVPYLDKCFLSRFPFSTFLKSHSLMIHFPVSFKSILVEVINLCIGVLSFKFVSVLVFFRVTYRIVIIVDHPLKHFLN